ncbi:MAG: pitrilysin family protein, partial [Leptolyngbyaceae cyanobacterium MO_188.B28]|nr:pitrilysin family protein [Leptolyngbyaceae cyanobacterium MO_188.B28]
MHWFKFFSQRWQRRWAFWVLLGLTTFGLLWTPGWRSAAIATPAKHYTDLEFPPLAEIQFPDYERYELDNGIVVYLMEDHELPLVNGSATFRTGNRLDPSDKVGLSSIMGDTLRMGGTETYPPAVLNQRLEQRAASVETGVGIASGSASFNALTEDLDEVFALFSDVIRYPAFDPAQVDLVKTQYQGSIARRNDSPDDIASREFRKLIYGGDSPYARTIEYANLNNISREDLLAFYRASFQPNNMILGIVGDFDSATMKARVEKYFGDWKVDKNRQITTELPDVSQANTGIFFIDQP